VTGHMLSRPGRFSTRGSHHIPQFTPALRFLPPCKDDSIQLRRVGHVGLPALLPQVTEISDLQTSASLMRHGCKLLQVDISGPWCTIYRTASFELAFSL
jgi:hypothetical protein